MTTYNRYLTKEDLLLYVIDESRKEIDDLSRRIQLQAAIEDGVLKGKITRLDDYKRKKKFVIL